MQLDSNTILSAMNEIINKEPFKLEERKAIIERIYSNMPIQQLLEIFLYDYNSYLQEYREERNLDELNTNQFADALHMFFEKGYETKDGDRNYEFGYDRNSLNHSLCHQESVLEANNKKNTTTLLSHTCLPLLVPTDGSRRRAICSGYAELGCVIATCYGYECTPIAAMVTHPEKEDGVEYDYSHYLFSIKKGEDEPVVVDLQQANTIRRILMPTETDDIDFSRMHEQTMEQVYEKVSNMVLMNPTLESHKMLNDFKLHRGGLGVNIVGYLREKLSQYDMEGIVVVKQKGLIPKGVEKATKLYLPKGTLPGEIHTIFSGQETIGLTLKDLIKPKEYMV